jgi:hypothetical protein
MNQCFLMLGSSNQCCKNRTGPAGSTGWTGNRSQHRSGRKLKTASPQNREKKAKNRYEPVRTGGTGEPVTVLKNRPVQILT